MDGLIWLSLKRGDGWVTGGLVVIDDKVTQSFPYAIKRGWRPGRSAPEVWRELATVRNMEELRWIPTNPSPVEQ